MQKKILIVFCYDFPFKNMTAETNLLEFQLPVFKKIFRKIYIIPTAKLGTKKEIPKDYDINIQFRKFKIVSIYNSIKFLKFLILDLFKIKLNKNFLKMSIKSFIFYLKGIHGYSFLDSFTKYNNLTNKEIVIYTFWFNEYTFSSVLLKNKFPKLAVITGAHGYDLFEKRHYGGRIALREITISLINFVYVCSNEGKDYLIENYPSFASKFILINTGIKRKTHKVNFSLDNVFRIMTLSRTHPVKRISYLLKILKSIENDSKFKIQYFHIGGGVELKSLKNLKESLNFKKFDIELMGVLSDKELRKFFYSHKIDAFLNVSLSEGTSLSLVEALSYSLPVIVTKVGGNISIGENCGILLSKHFDSKELYNSLGKLYFNKNYKKLLSLKSYQYWLNNHDQKLTRLKLEEFFISI